MSAMLNGIKADTLRVLKKKSFILMTAIVLVMILAAAALAKNASVERSEVPGNFEMFVGASVAINNLLIGIPIFLAVFSDDFSSRAMQTLIGFGLSRKRLILCRFAEIIILTILCMLAFSLFISGIGMVMGVGLNSVGSTLKSLWEEALPIIFYSSISMMVVYAMQNAVLALVGYILMASGFVGLILSAIGFIPFLSSHNIDPGAITVSSLISRAEGGQPFFWLVLIGAYIILPLIVTMELFQKKELEF